MGLIESNSQAVMSRAGNPLRLLEMKQDRENYTGGGSIRVTNRYKAEIIYSDNPCDCCQWADFQHIEAVDIYCHTKCKR
jgi:hypothetical protein